MEVYFLQMASWVFNWRVSVLQVEIKQSPSSFCCTDIPRVNITFDFIIFVLWIILHNCSCAIWPFMHIVEKVFKHLSMCWDLNVDMWLESLLQHWIVRDNPWTINGYIFNNCYWWGLSPPIDRKSFSINYCIVIVWLWETLCPFTISHARVGWIVFTTRIVYRVSPDQQM